MGWYERWILPRLLDLACGAPAIEKQRGRLVPRARGRVLEIGAGSGLNFPYYAETEVACILALEPGRELRRMAHARARRLPLPVHLLGGSAERIPLRDASVDSVVVTYTLCTVRDPAAALREMRRVLRPEGQLLFCEHGAAPDAGVRLWQARLNPLWSRALGGCRLDHDLPRSLDGAGFQVRDLAMAYLPGAPRFASFNFWGAAQRR
jgi:SAM-dependent methyltransferase